MMQFNEQFPDANILQTLCAKLSWSHFKSLVSLKDPLAREFYAQMAITDGWSVRTLDDRINSMLFERTALSKKPEELIKIELKQLAKQGAMSEALILKDPYVLDFLELNDHYLERDLEDAILRNIEQFLLELGAGFTFIARQKRIHVAEYLSVLPSREILHNHLQRAINQAQQKYLTAVDNKKIKFSGKTKK